MASPALVPPGPSPPLSSMYPLDARNTLPQLCQPKMSADIAAFCTVSSPPGRTARPQAVEGEGSNIY